MDGATLRRQSLVVLVAAFSLLAFGSVEAQTCEPVPGEYLLRFNARVFPGGRAQLGQFRDLALPELRSLQVDDVRFESRAVPGLMRVRAVAWDPARVQRLIDDGVVLYAQPNCKLRRRAGLRASDIATLPGDPRFSELWAFDNGNDNDINAPQAWSMTTGSAEVVAGVLDGGVDFDHEDLRDSAWVNGQEIPGNGIDDDSNGYVDDIHGANVLEKNGNVRDTSPDSHGSHGAGSIGATGDNGRGVVGVSWRVRLMSINIFRGENEGGTTADVLQGWEYALRLRQRGVNLRVLNNSYGGHGENPRQAEIDMANQLNDAGILLVFSAGNDGGNNDEEGDTSNVPTPNAINVAAVNRNGDLAEFSNFGATTVHLAAPGVEILSTIQNNGYASYSGTSQSAPIVSGIAALLFSYEPTLSPVQVRQLLMQTVKNRPTLQGRMQAPGMVDAFAALQLLQQQSLETEE